MGHGKEFGFHAKYNGRPLQVLSKGAIGTDLLLRKKLCLINKEQTQDGYTSDVLPWNKLPQKLAA